MVLNNLNIEINFSSIIINSKFVSQIKVKVVNIAKIIIGIPKKSKVKVSAYGNVSIGDTYGQLEANVSGEYNLKAGIVSDSILSVEGNGKIFVDEVNSDLSMAVMRNGDISLSVVKNKPQKTIMGNGDIRIGN